MRYLIVLPLCAAAGALQAQAPAPAWDSVAAILKTATTPAPGYQRYNFPRRDLTVRLGDLTLAPGLALGAWAGFGGSPGDADMMGDLVLVAGELKNVLAELDRQGIAVTAIHNHLAGEVPAITYLHYHAHGDALA